MLKPKPGAVPEPKPKATLLDLKDAILTYRYLRIMMVAALVMLGVAVVLQGIWEDCWLSSVSAYYYTPVRSVFVGALVAFGAALVAYHGPTPEEEALLNVSGFMSLVVAFVPTGYTQCHIEPVADTLTTGIDATGSSEPAPPAVIEGVDAAVSNNMWSLAAAVIVALVIVVAVKVAPDPKEVDAQPEPTNRLLKVWWRIWAKPGPAVSQRWVKYGRYPLVGICSLVPLAGFAWFYFRPEEFAEAAHGAAAITLVVGLILYMIVNAALNRHTTRYALTYQILAIALIATLIGFAAVIWKFDPSRAIFWLEFSVLGIFVVYWLVQSFELRGQTAERGKQSESESDNSAENNRPSQTGATDQTG